MPGLRAEGRAATARRAAAEMDCTLPEGLQEMTGVEDGGGGDGGGCGNEVKANPALSFF